MQTLHLANTNFEFELVDNRNLSLSESLKEHPLLLQLQFLPLIYAEADDGIAVTQFPEIRNQHFVLLDEKNPINSSIFQPWGLSQQVATWAKNHSIPIDFPNWDVVKQVNSKVFSFTHSPQLHHSQLISNESELKLWIQSLPQKNLVLKSAYGVSGRGNLRIDGAKEIPWNRILTFCNSEWQHHRPVIGEPWVDRILDFSTQWHIEKKGQIHFIGAAIIQNTNHGTYQSTFSGPENELFKSFTPLLEQHKIEARKILELIKNHGYFGPAGIDSMIYQTNQPQLHPIVEVNARQTMSLAAILHQRKYHPNQIISLSYTKLQQNRQGLLPEKLGDITFTRQLYKTVGQ